MSPPTGKAPLSPLLTLPPPPHLANVSYLPTFHTLQWFDYSPFYSSLMKTYAAFAMNVSCLKHDQVSGPGWVLLRWLLSPLPWFCWCVGEEAAAERQKESGNLNLHRKHVCTGKRHKRVFGRTESDLRANSDGTETMSMSGYSVLIPFLSFL